MVCCNARCIPVVQVRSLELHWQRLHTRNTLVFCRHFLQLRVHVDWGDRHRVSDSVYGTKEQYRSVADKRYTRWRKVFLFSNKKHKNVNIRQKNTMYSQLFQGRGQTGAVQLWHLYVSMLGFDDHLWRWNGTLYIFRYKQSYACDFTLIFLLSLSCVFWRPQTANNAFHLCPNWTWRWWQCRSVEERANGDDGLAIDAREFDSTWQFIANVAPSIIITICKWLIPERWKSRQSSRR